MGPGLIVVDTNVLAYFVIEGDHTQNAEAVRARDHDWRVPSLCIYEWLNVVALHVRKGLFARDDGIRYYRRGLALVRIEAALPDPRAILNLVTQSGCSSYDCQFVALAQSLHTRLVTTDKELVAAFPGVAEDLSLIH